MNDREKYALFASSAYDVSGKEEILNYKLDRNLNPTRSHRVYLGSDEVIVAIRGSVTAQDWLISDVAIFMGKLEVTPRFLSEVVYLRKVIKKYGKSKKIVLVGHSLGGALAVLLLRYFEKNIDRIYVYNAGTSFKQAKGRAIDAIACKLKRNSNRCRLGRKINEYRVKGDIVSLLGKFTSTQTIEKKEGELLHHGVGNFTRDEEEVIPEEAIPEEPIVPPVERLKVPFNNVMVQTGPAPVIESKSTIEAEVPLVDAQGGNLPKEMFGYLKPSKRQGQKPIFGYY